MCRLTDFYTIAYPRRIQPCSQEGHAQNETGSTCTKNRKRENEGQRSKRSKPIFFSYGWQQRCRKRKPRAITVDNFEHGIGWHTSPPMDMYCTVLWAPCFESLSPLETSRCCPDMLCMASRLSVTGLDTDGYIHARFAVLNNTMRHFPRSTVINVGRESHRQQAFIEYVLNFGILVVRHTDDQPSNAI